MSDDLPPSDAEFDISIHATDNAVVNLDWAPEYFTVADVRGDGISAESLLPFDDGGGSDESRRDHTEREGNAEVAELASAAIDAQVEAIVEAAR
uniref:Uncharacterized protein n=1 Tax=Chromera velia CCMP2878 TaxID=1169474 RepID=A0A0G4GD16_9ALVE|mmetsp:Transcript_34542/g.68303  ORF Transcript_34542/g.68303 Transcript_34542/m.68303 type:complete len:94 (+) Transcript_34542:308-589(+)|eukprot:Cvel_21354.t1-p1 / transcript=Cvel_21354.t1 / gene=Cvel_21354 / organism=Chromera_velia_CCMP2878 / gene_product=hypothetical protein / transcript_product=hypothetical protein / location=Cvel_scaffold1995:2230-4257(+) / protein_length=93 / sequence_SO=supercontig / SO=protein_coding / is_pseudo=false